MNIIQKIINLLQITAAASQVNIPVRVNYIVRVFMRKLVVIIALLFLIFGVICLLVNETRLEEELINELNLPSKLYPYKLGQNMPDSFACIFIEKARGENEVFRQLLDKGKISEVMLEVFINASGNVSVKVGKFPSIDPKTNRTVLSITFFDRTGQFFNERIEVPVNSTSPLDISSYYWEVRNEWTDVVTIFTGYVRLKAEIPKNYHPYYGLGTLVCLSGTSLAIYGFLAKPAKKRR